MTHRRAGPIPILAGCLLSLVAATPVSARTPSLETWIDDDLTRYVAEHLVSHPRFRDAAVQFVVFEKGRPAAESNRLALRLARALADNVVDTPGTRVLWRPQHTGTASGTGTSSPDCEADTPDYYVGLELEPVGADRLHVTLRALDLHEKSWVSGFGLDWRGRIDRGHRYALQQSAVDPHFLGERAAPYDAEQADLLAARLAARLACSLMRQTAGEYVLSAAGSDEDEAPIAGVLELVGANVAGTGLFRFAATPAEANALLDTRVHRVDGDLHQVWASVTPAGADTGLAAISVSAYVRLPGTAAMATLRPPARSERTGSAVAVPTGSLLEPLRVVRLAEPGACVGQAPSTWSSWPTEPADCLGLEIAASGDAVVFLLAHQQNHGLVRLDDGACRYRTAARVLRAGQPLRVALPGEPTANRWEPAAAWQLDPAADVYYAIAVGDARTARQLARHLDELPQRCSVSMRPGLEGAALERWLERLAARVAAAPAGVDWQAVAVRAVY